jgi:hypothetical protein
MIEIKEPDDKDGLYMGLRLFDVPEVVTPKATIHAVPISEVEEVFNHWVATFRSTGRGPVPILSDKRKTKIARAIKDYDVQTCLDAISGCALSDWHMGDNPRGKKYDDIELILRDSLHIEKFATIWAEDGNAGRSDFLDDN